MFNTIDFARVLSSEKYARETGAFKRMSERYGGLMDGASLESELKYAWFAFIKSSKQVSAYIFEDIKKCDNFIKGNSGTGYVRIDFEKFKKEVGDAWKDPNNYYADLVNLVTIFHCLP